MSLRGCNALIDDLVRIYPQEVILEQLVQLYRAQIRRVIQEIELLAPHCQTYVSAKAYERDLAKMKLVEAWVGKNRVDVQTLERSLKYLLTRQRAMTAVLHEGESS